MATARLSVGHGVTRRALLQAGAAAAGGLILGVHLPAARRASAAAQTTDEFAPNAFIRIGGDGRIVLIVDKCEVGQGVYTSLPMLLAEELDVALDQIAIEPAPPDDVAYADPLLQFQVTGNSSSVRGAWDQLRHAGAAARQMLLTAAAQQWAADVGECRTDHGEVIHPPTGRRLRYGALAATAARLSVPDNPPLKSPQDFKLIGTSPLRLDLPGKVDGSAQYGIDIRLPEMKIATVVACPVFGGKLAELDDSRAKSIPGVRQIVRLDGGTISVAGHTVPLDAAVAVVADHMWAAKQGADALEIDWDAGPHANVSTADVVRGLEAAAQREGLIGRQEGDVATAMSGAAQRVQAVYQDPFLSHAPMEPMTCVAQVRPDACDIWTATQVQARAQATAAQIAGLPPEKVTVHNLVAGGAFGRRLDVDGIARAVQIARQVDGPVKMVWTREQDIQHDLYRPYYYDRVAAGLDAQGRPVAWTQRIVGSSVMARFAPVALQDGLDPDAVDGAIHMPYAIPNLKIDYVREEPPGIPTAFWRGVGPTHNVFVIESFMDELAVAAKQDPVAYRRAVVANERARTVLDLAAEKSGWGNKLPPRSGRGVSLTYTFDSYLATVAEVTVSEAGLVRLQRVICALDCGMIVHPDTIAAQIEGGALFGMSAALFSEITLKNGRVEQSNFNDYRSLRIDEAPEMQVHIVPSTERPGGIGETGTVGAAPALANAVYAATGTRVRTLPIRLNRERRA